MGERAYQTALDGEIQAAWVSVPAVLARLDTGGGKTRILSGIHRREQGPSCVTAHRHELCSQISKALAQQGLRHKVIGSEKTIRACHQEHIAEFGTSFVNPSAAAAVASIDTLVNAKGLENWAAQVRLSTTDEAHHLVEGNKWAKGLDKFTHPHLRILGMTATPNRADGKGLGRGHGGVFDTMVQGPPMRWLMEQGYLTEYKIVCPSSDLAVLEEAGASGDWNSKQLREAAERSHIIGDVVQNYLTWAKGKLTIVFSTDVVTATEQTLAFQKAGVRAATLTGDTDPGVRRAMLQKFAARGLDVLVAVDIISEGFDLPAIECAIFARPTQSLALFMQQFGRALRAFFAAGWDLDTQAGRLAAIATSCKPWALIIDLVGNTLRHQGPPDKPRFWTLEARGRRGSGGGIPYRVCMGCIQPYERFLLKCPYCGKVPDPPEPGARGTPAAVDGDTELMPPELLNKLRGEIEELTRPVAAVQVDACARNMPPQGVKRLMNLQAEKLEAQAQLWDAIGDFGGVSRVKLARQLATDADTMNRELQRLFFATFNVDILTARTLAPADAIALRDRIRSHLA
jgi:DNA repair protein RadD